MKQELSITTVFLIVALLLFHFVFHSTYVGEWRTLSTMAIDAGERRILLVPLDSRPAVPGVRCERRQDCRMECHNAADGVYGLLFHVGRYARAEGLARA